MKKQSQLNFHNGRFEWLFSTRTLVWYLHWNSTFTYKNEKLWTKKYITSGSADCLQKIISKSSEIRRIQPLLCTTCSQQNWPSMYSFHHCLGSAIDRKPSLFSNFEEHSDPSRSLCDMEKSMSPFGTWSLFFQRASRVAFQKKIIFYLRRSNQNGGCKGHMISTVRKTCMNFVDANHDQHFEKSRPLILVAKKIKRIWRWVIAYILDHSSLIWSSSNWAFIWFLAGVANPSRVALNIFISISRLHL